MGDCRDDRPGWAAIRTNSGTSQRLRHQSLHGLYVLCRRDVVRVRYLHIHQGQVGLVLDVAMQLVVINLQNDGQNLLGQGAEQSV
jgi:hypothetical protein